MKTHFPLVIRPFNTCHLARRSSARPQVNWIKGPAWPCLARLRKPAGQRSRWPTQDKNHCVPPHSSQANETP